jgi:ferric-dicitrate binding protein FerR (iron transport regulator)
MQNVYSADELILNDSFINYCLLGNPEDVSRWENYLLQNPFEKKTVEEAKSFVLGLNSMLKAVEKDKELERFRKALSDKTFGDVKNNEINVAYMAPDRINGARKMKYRWYAAASVFIVIAIAIWLATGKSDQRLVVKGTPEEVTNMVLTENSVTRTGAGETKLVFLPDGTKVTMNVKTTLTVDSSFGMNARLVKLDGEAFFDVHHNTRSPFIVQLKDFKIRVLGTMFNVRSYSEDKNSETALVKGKVEIILKNNSHEKLFLKPNEKAILSNAAIAVETTVQNNKSTMIMQPLHIAVKPLTISNDGNSIIETGWIQHRLELDDETFGELKNKLERWYGVDIRFNDEEVKQYRFTATFENENIDQALKAMQLSYPFNYTKNNNQIMISKK